MSNCRNRKGQFTSCKTGGSFKYKIFEGYDHNTGRALYQVTGVNNDYVGEWHTRKKDAQVELKALRGGRAARGRRANQGRRARATRKFIGNFGDIGALEYGGGLILQSGGDYHLVRFEGWEDRQQYRPGEFNSYGDPKPGAKMAVSIVHFAPGEKHWSEDWDLKAVASTYGMPVSELRGMLRSKDPRVMAGGIEAIAGYSGWGELDSYPEDMTRTEINKIWGRWL